MNSFRTEKTEKAYQEFLSEKKSKHSNGEDRKNMPCFMCNAPALRTWKWWKEIKNDFPYDAIAVESNMLVLNNHAQSIEKAGAMDELYRIKFDLEKEGFYDLILENFKNTKTHVSHLHYHLLKRRKQEEYDNE